MYIHAVYTYARLDVLYRLTESLSMGDGYSYNL